MPILLPAEPWKATGRWDLYGETLFRLRDRHERELLLGPTQEEVVAGLVARDLPSYRDLPVNLYQVEWKYRDEFRPRFGLLRAREFLMKDAYTFDRDEAGMAASYDVMLRAYRRVFDRCGLSYIVVEAEPGQIGGGVNHEFMARADVGEDLFVECVNGDYLADWKAATPRPPEPASADGAAPLEKVHTPDAATIDAVSKLLDVPAERTLKTMLFDAGGGTVAVLLPGDREVEEAKVERLLFPAPVRRFEDADFAARGFAKGYVGPQGLGRGRDDPRGSFGAWRQRLGDRRQRGRPPRHRCERPARLPRRSVRGRDRPARGRPLPDRRWRAPDRPLDRRGAHLSARHAVLGAPEGDVRRRGRFGAAVPDGELRHRHLADPRGRGRAVPRRDGTATAEGARAVRGGDRAGQPRPGTRGRRGRAPLPPSCSTRAWTRRSTTATRPRA